MGVRLGVFRGLHWPLRKQSKFSGLGLEKEKTKCTVEWENS